MILKELNINIVLTYKNQVLMLNLLFSVDAIFTGKFKQYKKVDHEYKLFESKINREESNEQPYTIHMSDLESEESQQGKGLKILAPNQILSRLPDSLAQLKAGNNSEKLKT